MTHKSIHMMYCILLHQTGGLALAFCDWPDTPDMPYRIYAGYNSVQKVSAINENQGQCSYSPNNADDHRSGCAVRRYAWQLSCM